MSIVPLCIKPFDQHILKAIRIRMLLQGSSGFPQQFSSSLESIPSERSWAPNTADTPWQFSEREVTISDKVLGRGAFGEVRVAKWRNIEVAAKRLHMLNNSEADQHS